MLLSLKTGMYLAYQYVHNDWFPNKNGGYYLVYQPHEENWSDTRKREIVNQLRSTLGNGGKLFGTYHAEKLIGFASLDGILLGSKKQYVELTWFHVSYEYRGNKIGKQFIYCIMEGKKWTYLVYREHREKAEIPRYC